LWDINKNKKKLQNISYLSWNIKTMSKKQTKTISNPLVQTKRTRRLISLFLQYKLNVLFALKDYNIQFPLEAS